MFEETDKRFEYMIELLSKHHDVDLDIVKKAYAKAKELHYYQKRKDGIPYISHPVEVAIILAELDFGEDAVCAALLHDTVEDCNYTIEQMKKDFNLKIANAVDAVTAIDKTQYIYNDENIFEDPNFVKSSAEEQTFKKLISIGKNNPLGFYVKFADRLHNLRTIDTFEYSKQIEKVRETEKWILPIAKALKAQYFDIKIKNECFKILNKIEGQNFFNQYDAYHKSNFKQVNYLLTKFKENFEMNSVRQIVLDDISERKVFESLQENHKNINIKNIPQGQLLKVPNYAFYIVYSNGTNKDKLTDQILSKFNKDLNFLKIVNIRIGDFSNLQYYIFVDDIKNLYKLYILSANEYDNLKIGAMDGRYNDLLDEENANNLDMDTIKVKTISGEIKPIPKGSTVLDFAFKIHKDIGFAFKYALINGGKTKFPAYTKLNQNDTIEIVTEKDAEGNLINNAKLRWLAYVNTEFAKKVLIKWFENMQN